MIRIGLVVPQRGPTGMFGPSCVAAARMAVEEINQGAGIVGQAVELVVIDAGGAPEAVADAVEHQMLSGGLHAVTGWHISSVRRAIIPRLGGRVPYVYPALYEGGEAALGTFCTGEVPEAQIRPVLEWMRQNLGVSRWFIAGSDYVWPRQTAAAAAEFIRGLGLELAGTDFVPLGASGAEAAQLVGQVERSGAHGVLMLFPGQDGVEFNRRFSAAGLDSSVLRFSPLLEENMLMAIGADSGEGLFTSAGYFRSAASAGAMDFQSRFAAAYGTEAPALNSMAESTYSALHVIAALAQRGGGLSVPQMSWAAEGEVLEVPRGELRFEGCSVRQDVYLAAAEGLDLSIVDKLEPQRF